MNSPARMDSLALQLDILQAIVLELVERLPPAELPAAGRDVVRVIAAKTPYTPPARVDRTPEDSGATQIDELLDVLRRRH